MSELKIKKGQALSGSKAARILLGAFFLVSVIVPVVALAARMFQPGALAVFSTPSFGSALLNSVVSAGVGMVLSVSLAFVAALCLTRAHIAHREAWAVALTLPMLIPSIAHGMGLVYLFGSNGIVTNFVGADWSIYGMQGIVLGSLLYSFPPAFLMLYDALRYEDCEVYDAADIMGIPKISQFFRITVPYMAKPLVSAAFATFTLIVTDYGVPIMVGGKCTTLSVLMYQEVIGRLNFDAGIAVGVVLIFPAIAAFVVDLLTSGEGNLGFSAHIKRIDVDLVRDVLAHAILVALVIFMASPLIAFAVVAFVVKYPIDLTFTLANVNRAMVFGMGSYLANSLVIAVAVSIIGTALSWLAAYMSARTPGRFGRALHLVCIVTMAIPGIVLGLAYMLLFKDSPIYGTMGILILVNLVHFFASPYLMARNALFKLNSSLEAVGQTLGIPYSRMIVDVLLPQTKGTVIEMAGYYFVNCMVTISAVAFLANVSYMPLALLISDFDTQMLVECAALVSIVIFVTNVVVKVLLAILKRFVMKRQVEERASK